MSEDEGPGIEELRQQVVNLRDVELPALRTTLEGERDAAKAEAEQLRGEVATAKGERDAAQAEAQAFKDAALRVPGGAGGRQAVDTSAMSASEKIRYGLAERGG